MHDAKDVGVKLRVDFGGFEDSALKVRLPSTCSLKSNTTGELVPLK